MDSDLKTKDEETAATPDHPSSGVHRLSADDLAKHFPDVAVSGSCIEVKLSIDRDIWESAISSAAGRDLAIDRYVELAIREFRDGEVGPDGR